MQKRSVGGSRGNFVFHVRLGEYEIEIGGMRDEVLKTIEELPSLMVNVCKAFESLKPKTVATLTVKTGGAAEEALKEKYPKIPPTGKCDEAVLKILETDWGKWRPRTLDELREALKANGLNYSRHTLEGVLVELAKSERVRRWKTDGDYVYILAEKGL
ncbi:MAG: hypothetical protein QXZ25_03380 [Candidatus Bathyarchaeia archaeon]